MFTRFRRLREPYRMLAIGLLTLLVLVIGRTWPAFAIPAWGAFGALMAALLWADIKEPVNYDALRLLPEGIEYVAAGRTTRIRFDEIAKVEYEREEAMFPDLDGPYIESKWWVRWGSGDVTEVMDEWPHRESLLRAFTKHLPCFDEMAARQGIAARAEGRWLCYARPAGDAPSNSQRIEPPAGPSP